MNSQQKHFFKVLKIFSWIFGVEAIILHDVQLLADAWKLKDDPEHQD